MPASDKQPNFKFRIAVMRTKGKKYNPGEMIFVLVRCPEHLYQFKNIQYKAHVLRHPQIFTRLLDSSPQFGT